MHEPSPNPPRDRMTALPVAGLTEWAAKIDGEYRADLMRYAYSLCGDVSLAEDAVQETYLRLMQQSPESLDGHLAPWLFRVCRSRIIDARRKSRRLLPLESEMTTPFPDPSAPDPQRSAESSDVSALIQSHIAELTPSQQEVLRLKYQAHLNYREIAEVTGKTVNAVGVSLHGALKALRTRLSGHPEW